MKLLSEIQRIKNIMGIISEQETNQQSSTESQTNTELNNPKNEEEFVNLVKSKGFQKIDSSNFESSGANKFWPSSTKVNVNDFKWLYINFDTKVYAYKFKKTPSIKFGQRAYFSPKENKDYAAKGYLIESFPIQDWQKDKISELIINMVKLDLGYDLDSVVRKIDSARIWGPGDITTQDGKYFFKGTPLSQDYVKSYITGAKFNVNEIPNLISSLPPEDLNKPITNQKGEKFNTINDYFNQFKKEAQELKFIA